jgi:carbon-monoxide dehydrogenase large subunit
MSGNYFGVPLRRLEDPALLTGRGRYVDDISLPGMVHAAFVRSPHAHAEIRGVRCDAARAAPGVVAVYTIDDLAPHITNRRVPEGFPKPGDHKSVGPYVLADGEVCHVGEPVAVAIAESRYLAEDAAALVEVDYQPLPVTVDCRAALEEGAAIVDRREGSNLVTQYVLAFGDCDGAFAAAPHVIRDTLYQHRGCCQAMECRGIVAHYEAADDRLKVWRSTQAPHSDRAVLVKLFGWEENRVRVITPDLGGGFGPKLILYPDEATVSVAATILARPVKWIEDRREHFLATTQERDQVWEVEIAMDEAGKILGLRGKMTHDQGAYTARGANVPYSSASTILGPYVVPSYRMEVRLANTNKVPVTSLRGAGHPQGAYTMERMLDRAARALGIERAEVRRRNLIPGDAMPFTHPLKTQAGPPITYDSGDYPKCQSDALAAIDYDGFPVRRAAARAEGRYLGIAIANYVKPTGRGPFETGRVRIGTSGRVSVLTGAIAMGQGFRTAMSQIAADQLGVDPADIIVVAGDTDAVPLGQGAFASRQTVNAGSSIHLAAREVREKLLRIGAHMLEASEADLELAAGRVRVKGVADMSLGFGEISNAVAGTPGYSLPEGITPGLEATANFRPEGVTYANGTHAVEVEVDADTGAVSILRYIVVHDSGRLINPLIVDGQVHGGVAHGIGNAIWEWMRYDDDGQPLTTTLAEYLLPTAVEMPHMEIIHHVSPTPRNPLGVKGVGECGVMSAAPAMISAIEHALEPFSVHIDRAPVTPAMIVDLIREAGATGDPK